MTIGYGQLRQFSAKMPKSTRSMPSFPSKSAALGPPLSHSEANAPRSAASTAQSPVRSPTGCSPRTAQASAVVTNTVSNRRGPTVCTCHLLLSPADRPNPSGRPNPPVPIDCRTQSASSKPYSNKSHAGPSTSLPSGLAPCDRHAMSALPHRGAGSPRPEAVSCGVFPQVV